LSEPKLHHYVPRFYLERFADKKGRFWVWDKKTHREFSTGAQSVAAEKQFYRIPELIGTQHDPLFLERNFAQIEGQAAYITKQWLTEITTSKPNDKISIGKDDRELVALYIALQAFRTLDAREILAAFAQEYGPYKKGISAEEAVNLHGYFLERGMVIYDVANRLFRSTWIFARNDTGHPFVTSDNPVCFKTPDNRMWLKAAGILGKGVYATFPLSPTVILYSHDHRHRRYKALKKFSDAVSPVIFTPDMVDHENSGQVFMASRFVVSSQPKFEFIRSFFASNVEPPFDQKGPPRDSKGASGGHKQA
jgi:Protein of unknown function (DUF4238)